MTPWMVSIQITVHTRSKLYIVSSDLQNLEMSGNFDAQRKSQGISMHREKVREFCWVKSIFNQSEHPNFENFLGDQEHAPDPHKHSWAHIRIKTSFIFCSSRGGQNSINLEACTAYQMLFHVQTAIPFFLSRFTILFWLCWPPVVQNLLVW